MWVVYPNSFFLFILPTESISLSLIENVLIFQKFYIDFKTIKYPKNISRMINESTREDITTETFRNQALECW